MRVRSVVVPLAAVVFLCASGYSQTRAPRASGNRAVGIANVDSIRAYQRALARKDTTALKRYSGYSGATKVEGPREAHLIIMARADLDSVVLRWAPSKPGAWIETNKFGYQLDRVALDKQGKVVPGSLHRLSTEPLKAWPLDEWKQRASRDNKFAAIAAQALYGKSFKSTGDVPEGVRLRQEVDELQGRYGFALFAADMDPLVATGLALRFVDRDVKQGEQYVYRLHLAVKDTAYRLDTAYAVASPARHEVPPPPLDLAAQSYDRHITLEWKDYPPGLAYTAFNVYRSEDGGKTYRRLNSDPIVSPVREGAREKLMPNYTDTTAVNYRVYRYRVTGITPFAEESKPAEVEAFATDQTPPPRPVVAKPEQIARHAVRLTWQVPDTVKDLAGFVVSRSAQNMDGYSPISLSVPGMKTTKGKGKEKLSAQEQLRQMRDMMKQLLPPTTRSYVDNDASSAEPYYLVGAVDTSGNLSQSLPVYAAIIDSIPPRIPAGLAGTIDTNGVVHLHWHLGPEPNIIGYRILWANDPRHEFTMRAPRPVKDTVFTDTINIHTLTHYIYYRIAAVNDRFIHSPLSPMLALRRPDVVPPGTPVFTGVHVSDSSVTLGWVNSASDDVRRQVLYRRVAGEPAWSTLASLDPKAASYVDRGVKQRVMYEYTLEAVDSSGLHSERAVPVQGRPYDNGERPGVSGLVGSYDQKAKAVRLTWKYGAPLKERFWFAIYRSYGGSSRTQLKSVESSARVYSDGDLVGKGRYTYAVRVQTSNGGVSAMSDTVSVQVK